MGQAAELLDVQPAFLRSLDAAGVLKPTRSGGGHRRYSRRQLQVAARMRELFDQGMTLDAAARIVGLQDQLETARPGSTSSDTRQPVTAKLTTPDRGSCSVVPSSARWGDLAPRVATSHPVRAVRRDRWGCEVGRHSPCRSPTSDQLPLAMPSSCAGLARMPAATWLGRCCSPSTTLSTARPAVSAGMAH